MKKYVKDLLKHQLASEEAQLKELKKIYQRAIRDCDEAIRQLSARKDMENLQAIIYQQQFQEALKKQLEGIVDQLGSRQFTSISQYLNECYVDGYVGNAYALMQQGIPLLLPIDQEKVVRAVKTDSKLSKGLYAALGEDVTKLKKDVRMQLSRGIASGKNWHQVADDLAGDFRNTPFNKAYNRSMTIVRTEGHRISEAANFDGMRDAKAAGADVVKQWVSVLDGATRPNHRTLDGQIRELEEPYEVDNLQAMYPGGFGVAKEDCNCRCNSTQRAKWALGEDELAELQSRADYWGLDKSQEFDEFKEKYLKLPDNADTINVNSDVCKELQKIRDRLNGKRASMSDLIEAGKIVKNHIGDYQMSADEKEYNDAYNKVMEMSKLIRSGKMSVNDEYREVYKRWKDAEQKVQNLEETHAKWLSESLSEIRQMGTKGIESDVLAHLGNSRSTVRKYVENAYSYYPRDWVEKSMQRGGLSPKKVKRGYYSDFNEEIAISGEGGRAFQTSVHELGHRFEKAVPEIRDAEEEFYKHRTDGESLKWLGQGYRRDEKTRFDNFIDPYMGKDYGGSAYELVSMGFELAFTHPDRLAKDPEMQSWILGILSLY